MAGAGWPFATAKTFEDLRAVGMNWPLLVWPELAVHAMSQAAEGMVPLRTPCLSRWSASCWWRGGWDGACVVHWERDHVRESLSVCEGAKVKDTRERVVCGWTWRLLIWSVGDGWAMWWKGSDVGVIGRG